MTVLPQQLKNFVDVTLLLQLTNTIELHWELESIRRSLNKWLQLRGKPKTRCLAAAKEAPLGFNVEIQDMRAMLFLFSEIMQTDPNLEAEAIKCSTVSKSSLVTCYWVIPETYLRTSVLQKHLTIPFHDSQLRLPNGTGSIYVEGPVTISLRRQKTANEAGLLIFRFSKIYRYGWTGKEMWRFPPLK